MKAPRKQKASYKQLAKQLADLQAAYATRGELLDEIRRDNHALHKKVQERVDTTMIDQRIKLAATLGQAIDAYSHAIRYVIGGESAI